MIRTKDRQLKKLIPNEVQEIFLEQIEYMDYGKLEGRRDIILKARQLGFSTLLLALLYCDTVNNPHTYTVVMAQDQQSTERLFQVVKRYHDNCPPHKKIQAKYESKRELYWPSIDSYFFVGTAGSKEKFGRGGTINNVHGSEVAFWDNAEDIVAGLLETVPASGNIFLETTANGVGNFFYEEYTNAEKGLNEFSNHFFPWFYSSEYRIPASTPLELSDREKLLVDKYNLDDEQIAWYRLKGLRLKELLVQEHPSSAEEAFVSSGMGFFNHEHIMDMYKVVRHSENVQVPAKYFNLRAVPQSEITEEQLVMRGAKNQELIIYKKPVPGRNYVIGADPAEGIRETGDHDYCSAHVMDYETWEEVAHLHGRWEPNEFGTLLAELGRWYNFALLAVERNNHGHSVINTLLNVEGYDRKYTEFGGLYYYEEYDGTTKKKFARPGWPENMKTKTQLLNMLAAAIEEKTASVNSKDTLDELRMYSKLPGGKFGPEGNNHDDRVISLALCIMLCHTKIRSGKRKGSRLIKRGSLV